MADREIDARLCAVRRDLRLRLQRDAVAGQRLRPTQREQARGTILPPRQSAILRHLRAREQRAVRASPLEPRIARDARCAVQQLLLVPGGAGQRQPVGQRQPPVQPDLARAAFDHILLAQPKSGVLLARIGRKVERGAVMFHLRQPGGAAAQPLRAAGRGLRADLRIGRQARAGVDRQQRRIADRPVAQRGGAQFDRAARDPHRRARAAHRFAAAAPGFVIDHDEDRIARRIAAQHRLAEADRPGERIDVIVDMPRHRRGRDDQFGTQPVAHLDPQPVGVGHDVARRQAIRAGQAVALDFVAAIQFVGMRGEGGDGDAVAFVGDLRAGQRAAVAAQLRVAQPGFVIAQQRHDLAPFQPQVQLARGGGVIALARGIAVDGVIAIRVDGAEQPARPVARPLAVIGDGGEPRSLDPPLGIKRQLAVQDRPGAIGGQRGAAPRQDVVPDRAGAEADDRPARRAGRQPCADRFVMRRLRIRERDGGAYRARLRRGLQFDEGDAVVADDAGDRGGGSGRCRRRGGGAAALVERDVERGGVGRLHPHGDAGARTHRTAGTVGQPHRHQRAGDAIGDEAAGLRQRDGMGRRARRMDDARDDGDDRAVGGEHARLDPVVAVDQRDAAPARDGDAGSARFRPVERERIALHAVHDQRDALFGQMLDDDAHRGGAGVVIGQREQHRDALRLTVEPVAIARGDRIGCDGDRQRGRGIRRAAGRRQLEIDALQQPAVTVHEARQRIARRAGIGIARDRTMRRRNAVAVELDDVAAGADPLQMVQAVAVGDDEGAVLQQDAHACHARAAARGIAARALRHAADHGEAVAGQQWTQPDGGRRLVTRRAGAARCQHAVDRFARRRTWGDGDDVAKVDGGAGAQQRDRERQRAPVGGDARFVRPARRAGLIAQPGGQEVGHAHVARVAGGAIGQRDAISHDVAGRCLAHRCGLGEQQRGRAGAIDRHVGVEGIRLRQRETGAEGGIVEDERPPGGVAQLRQVVAGPGGRRGIARGRLDAQMVAPRRHQREAIAAGGQDVGTARGVAHRAAAGDGRGVTTDTVVAEDRGGAIGVVQQRHRGAFDRRAGGRIEDFAGWVDQQFGDRAEAEAIFVERQPHPPAAFEGHVARHRRGIAAAQRYPAGEHAGIGTGFEQRHRPVIAIGIDVDRRAFAHRGVAVAAGIVEHHDHRRAPVERRDRGGARQRIGVDRRGCVARRGRGIAAFTRQGVAGRQQPEAERRRALRPVDVERDRVRAHLHARVGRAERQRGDVGDARDIVRAGGGDDQHRGGGGKRQRKVAGDGHDGSIPGARANPRAGGALLPGVVGGTSRSSP